MENNNASPVIYSGRKNTLGDELCLVEAFSDFGENGWMVCEEVRCPGRKTRRTPKIWFADRAEAFDCMSNDEFWGFDQ
ncbi:MAG: hypothetical protein CMA72_07315 [Euryarchaeota archaeon]|nr:hypothetical protein [Euryarchaeota archaeon]|tara:strand:- start:1215 stop:1448 length:234 start_codon:yes stop_codon:yes gene_type:complete